MASRDGGPVMDPARAGAGLFGAGAVAGDALNEYIHHTGSATFAVPPGLRPGQHYGDALFTWAPEPLRTAAGPAGMARAPPVQPE